MSGTPPIAVDPFELPDHLGTAAVTWSAEDGIGCGHLVRGRLTSPGVEDVACDLMAIDQACPAPVADDRLRSEAHRAWRNGQVHLVAYDGRLTLLVPGTGFAADRVLVAIDRLTKALGAAPERYAVLLRLGADQSG